MRYETYTNRATGIMYKRISKNEAKKLFIDGHKLIIAPVKANMHCIFQTWAYIQHNAIDGYEAAADFDRVVNSFIFYNCNNEMGTYLKYFAPADVAKW